MELDCFSAVNIALSVLRHLLEKDCNTLLQLSYVIENLHNPVLDSCQPSYRMNFPSTTVPSAVSVTLARRAAQQPTRAPRLNSPGREPPAAAPPGGRPRRVTQPQPAVLPMSSTLFSHHQQQSSRGKGADGKGSPAAAKQGSSSSSASKSSSSKSKAAGGAPAAAAATPTELPKVLVFAQYWELFANIATLYSAQAHLVLELEGAVKKLTVLLEQQQQFFEEEEEGSLPPQPHQQHRGKRGGSVTSTSPSPSPRHQGQGGGALPPMPSSSSPSPQPQQRVHMQAHFRQLATILEEFFCGEAMKRYAAEHMMFTVNYSQKIAPRIVELARLWRWGAEGAAPKATPAFAATVLGRLSPEYRQTVQSYSLLLDFLFRSFGACGVPPDVRVACTTLPGQVEDIADDDAVSSSDGASAARLTAAAASGAHYKNEGKLKGGEGAATVRLPAMPADWKGFQTLMVLMSTPLPSLRRYAHVARCLVEGHVVLREDRARLTEGFINPVAQNMHDENDIVMDDIFQRDVENIMSLINVADYVNRESKRGLSAAATLLSTPSPSRVLMHYGRVSKRFRKGKHDRLLFLFSDIVCYVEESGSGGRLNLRGVMSLRNARVVDITDAPALEVINCFEITDTSDKRLTLFVSTNEQKKQWIYAIRYAAKRLKAATRATNKRQLSGASGGGTSGKPEKEKEVKVALLSRGSRLARQRRADAQWQEYLDNINGVNSAVDLLSPIELEVGSSAADVGGTAHGPHSNGSFTNRSTKHLDFEVTPWSRHSMHKRVRSQGSMADGATPPTSPTARGLGSRMEASATSRSRLATPLRRPVSEWFDTMPPVTPTGNSRRGSEHQCSGLGVGLGGLDMNSREEAVDGDNNSSSSSSSVCGAANQEEGLDKERERHFDKCHISRLRVEDSDSGAESGSDASSDDNNALNTRGATAFVDGGEEESFATILAENHDASDFFDKRGEEESNAGNAPEDDEDDAESATGGGGEGNGDSEGGRPPKSRYWDPQGMLSDEDDDNPSRADQDNGNSGSPNLPTGNAADSLIGELEREIDWSGEGD